MIDQQLEILVSNKMPNSMRKSAILLQADISISVSSEYRRRKFLFIQAFMFLHSLLFCVDVLLNQAELISIILHQ